MPTPPDNIDRDRSITIDTELSPLKLNIANRKKKKKMKKLNGSNKRASWQDIITATNDITDILKNYKDLSTQISLYLATVTITVPNNLANNVAILDSDVATYDGKLQNAMALYADRVGIVNEIDIADYLVVYETITTLGTDIIAVIQPTAEAIYIEYETISQLTVPGENNEQ